MSKYNPEDLVLWNEFSKAKKCGVSRWPGDFKFSLESSLTKEEKIELLDKYASKEGAFTYMVELEKKWAEERIDLPSDKDHFVKTNSLKAWLRKNDPKKMVDDYYHYGDFSLYGKTFKLQTNLQREPYHDILKDSVVCDLFHEFCKKQCYVEEQIYRAKDPKAIKFGKIREFAREYQFFGIQMLCDFAHNLDSDEIEKIDESLMDLLIAKFEEFEKIQAKFNDDFVKIAKDHNWREGI